MELFFKLNEAGVPVDVMAMVLKSGVLDPEFAPKVVMCKMSSSVATLKANCINIRAGTRVSQQNPQDMLDEALTLVQYMRPQLSAPDVDQDYVVNMDQTPVYFTMAPRTTLKLMGNSTIHIVSIDGSTTRVSVIVGISASSKLFKPMLTFKERPTKQITLREFQTCTNRNECLLTCQVKTWADEENLMKWIDVILMSYLEVKPVGVTPVVTLDSFTVQKLRSIVQRIQNLVATVYHIPGVPLIGSTCRYWYWQAFEASNPQTLAQICHGTGN